MKQTQVAAFVLYIVGGALIGYNGGAWAIIGLTLVSLGSIVARYWRRGFNTDFSDMFEGRDLGKK